MPYFSVRAEAVDTSVTLAHLPDYTANTENSPLQRPPCLTLNRAIPFVQCEPLSGYAVNNTTVV